MATPAVRWSTSLVKSSASTPWSYAATVWHRDWAFLSPSNTVRLVAEQIIANGYVARPYLGIQWQPVTPAVASQFGLGIDYGALVVEVVNGSPSASAGLQDGDVILQLNNLPISEEQPFINLLFDHNPGDQVQLEVLRGNDTFQINVTLGELPSN